MQNTDNYNLKKPDYTDFADIKDINDNMDTIDGALAEKVDKNGDASDTKVATATASTASYPIPAAGDTFKVILGKIRKFFTDIKAAFVDASISGKTITLTKADGTTKTLTTQDTWDANAVDKAGYVAAPTSSQAWYVWMTGSTGAPGWKNNAATNAHGGLFGASQFRQLFNRVSAEDDSYNTTNSNKAWMCNSSGAPSWIAPASRTSGTITPRTAVCSSGSVYWQKIAFPGVGSIVQVMFDVYLKAGLNTENSAYICTGLPPALLQGASWCTYGAFPDAGQVLVDTTGKLLPWYIGTTTAKHFYGTLTYLSGQA